MEYPKTFDQCPLCHSSEKVIGPEVEELKKQGKVGADKEATSQLKVLPLSDATLNAISISVLLVYHDFCANCGFESPRKIAKKSVTREQLMALMGIPVQMPVARR